MDVLDDLQKNMELLQENLLMMQSNWDIKEQKLDWRAAPLKYPFQLCKRFMRKLIWWFMRPYYQMQIEFNGAAVRAVGDMFRIQGNLLALQQQSLENGVAISSTIKDILPESDLPRVIQIVASLNFGDAVGNDVIAIKNALKANGYVTEIYATSINPKIPKGTAKSIGRLPELKKGDMVIYHFAAEDPLVELIKKLPCRKILRYHNVTPPEFFHKYDSLAEKHTKNGLAQVCELKDYMDYAMADSEFNKMDLENMGYQCPIYVVPILIQFKDYMQTPSEEIVKKYSDGLKNIIFVGRVAPNKKIEDVIAAYDFYNKNVDPDTRLIIVGSYDEKNKYYEQLQRQVRKISAENVIFTGHIAFDEILGYYKIADAFLCMSEHEGFCVPLVEAMYFKVPIVAYSSTAVPYTLDGCGILLKSKQPEAVAEGLRLVLKDMDEKEKIINGEEKRLKYFNNEVVMEQMMKLLYEIAGE